MGAIVLLSGGLDSVVNFKEALDEMGVDRVLFFDYGQEAVRREREAVKRIAARYDVGFLEIRLDFMRGFSSALMKGGIPHVELQELDEKSHQTASAVWVPNRNGIFIEIAAGIAEESGSTAVVVGFNAEEAATFPDNSADYLDCMNMALRYSTRSRVRLQSYTLALDKRALYQRGRDRAAPLDLVWSCYHGGRRMCGVCESCQRLKRALGDDRAWFEEQHFRGGFVS